MLTLVLVVVLVVVLLEAVADAVVGGLVVAVSVAELEEEVEVGGLLLGGMMVVTMAISIAILMGMITMAPISPTMTPVARDTRACGLCSKVTRRLQWLDNPEDNLDNHCLKLDNRLEGIP